MVVYKAGCVLWTDKEVMVHLGIVQGHRTQYHCSSLTGALGYLTPSKPKSLWFNTSFKLRLNIRLYEQGSTAMGLTDPIQTTKWSPEVRSVHYTLCKKTNNKVKHSKCMVYSWKSIITVQIYHGNLLKNICFSFRH